MHYLQKKMGFIDSCLDF